MIGTLIFANPLVTRRRRRHKQGCLCVICKHKSSRRVGVRHRSKSPARARRKHMARTRVRRRGRRARVSRRRGRMTVAEPKVHRRRRRSRSRRRSHGRVRSHRRRRRARRNPLYRRRSGRHAGQYASRPGRRLHQYRPGGVGWHNPRRRRRRSRRNPSHRVSRRRSHRRRRYYSNPGGTRRQVRLLSDPVGAIKSAILEAFSMETLESVFHTGLGFGGAAIGARLVYKKIITGLDTPIGRVATHAGVSVIETMLAGLVGGQRFASRALAGGLLATLWQGLTEVLPAEAKEFVPTLGEGPETAEFRRAIEHEVLKQIRGGGDRGGMSVYLRPAGVQETYLRAAGSETYLTEREAVRASGNSAFMTEREAMQAGVGGTDDEFGRTTMPERF